MTDPAEIAKKLTPAQIVALRSLNISKFSAAVNARAYQSLLSKSLVSGRRPTELGRAVLAALDAKEST